MEIIVKHKKDKTDVIVFSTGILDEEFYPKHVHRNDLGWKNTNTCIVKLNASENYIGFPTEKEVFNLIRISLLFPKAALQEGLKSYPIISVPYLVCRIFDANGIPISEPFIGALRIKFIQINGGISKIFKELDKHRYLFSAADKNKIGIEIEKLELPKIKLEKLSAIEKINSEFDKLNKAETTEENIEYLNELEKKKKILIGEIKNIEENIKKFALPLTTINYRVLLVEHINPEEAY